MVRTWIAFREELERIDGSEVAEARDALRPDQQDALDRVATFTLTNSGATKLTYVEPALAAPYVQVLIDNQLVLNTRHGLLITPLGAATSTQPWE